MLINPDKNPVVKRSLVLAGGGMRVAYQAGVLMALEESGLDFSHVDGTSGGIFNTAMLTSGISPSDMAVKWRKLRLNDFVSGREASDYLKLFKMEGYADADNIRDKVFPHLGIDLHKINTSGLNATFNVCNFTTKEVEAIPGKEVQNDHLLAGVSLPIFMPALKINNHWYTDAVWIKDANLVEAAKQGSEEIWLVWAIGNSPTYLPGVFRQYVHMIEMSANGALLEEYKQIKASKPGAKLFVIKSPIPLPLDPDFFFNKINARELINMGYAHAKSYLSTKTDAGEPMDHTATQCSEPKDVFYLRAHYKGKLNYKNQLTPVHFHSYLQLADFETQIQLDIFSSLQLNYEDHETPTFQCKSYVSNKDGVLFLKTSSSLYLEGKVLKLSTQQKLASPWEIMLGLGFKSIHLQVKDETNTVIMEGKLSQSVGSRIKAIYKSNLISLEKSGLRKKLEMLRKLGSIKQPNSSIN